MAGKKTKPEKETVYNARDIVLAKVRGYPPWPAMVVDPEKVSKSVMKERPQGKKTPFYCVKFFPRGDHGWLMAKDMSLLKKHEIEAYINDPHKKSSELMKGYNVALDPTEWEKEREEAERAHLEEEANADIDQLDDEEGGATTGGDSGEKKTKKRKRADDGAAAAKGGSKKKKAAADGEEDAKPAKKPRKTKKNGVRSADTVESEDEGDKAPTSQTKRGKKEKDAEDEAKYAHLASDPEAAKIKEWRHKLQRAFLGKTKPSATELPSLDQLFVSVEQYDNYTIEYLSFSKIGKVMRHIITLSDEQLPSDNEYKFRERANKLLARWQGVIAGADETKEEAKDGDKAATNGDTAPKQDGEITA